MAIIAATSLTRFELNDIELISGRLLTLQNKQVIQNLLADCSEEKLNLKFNASNPTEFIQQEAECQGKIGILRYLLESSSLAEQDVHNNVSQDSGIQSNIFDSNDLGY